MPQSVTFQGKTRKNNWFSGKDGLQKYSHWRCHFFAFFPRTESKPCKKQILTSINKFVRQDFFFLRLFFAQAKNGITHFIVGCRRLSSGSSGFARRRIPNRGSTGLDLLKIDQAVTTEQRDTWGELDAIVFAMPPSATGIPLLNFHFADMLTIHVINRSPPFHITINETKEVLWVLKKSCRY